MTGRTLPDTASGKGKPVAMYGETLARAKGATTSRRQLHMLRPTGQGPRPQVSPGGGLQMTRVDRAYDDHNQDERNEQLDDYGLHRPKPFEDTLCVQRSAT
jgi:hypothetical protein